MDIAKVLKDDYRDDNSNQIICCGTNGNVRGFSLVPQTKKQEKVVASGTLGELSELYSELTKQKNVPIFLCGDSLKV
jgi:hypothetical protein